MVYVQMSTTCPGISIITMTIIFEPPFSWVQKVAAMVMYYNIIVKAPLTMPLYLPQQK